MKKISFAIVALMTCMSFNGAFALEEINLELGDDSFANRVLYGGVNDKQIYSVSGYAEDIKSSGANVSVITRKDIKKQNTPDLVDILNQQQGVSVQQANGSPGSVASVRMRGSDRVRFTVDGIRADRPSMTSPGFESQFFLSDDIERVEIVRGAQGNVNGVNASAGLIALQTRRGKGPLSFEAYSGMGNYGQFKERFALMGGDSKKDYYLGVTWYKTDGGLWTDHLGRIKNDDYNNLNVVANTGVRLLNEKADLRNIFRFSRARKNLGINNDQLTYQDYQASGNYGLNFDIMDVVSWDHVVNDKYNYDAKFGVYHNESDNFINPDNINGDPSYKSISKIRSSRLDFNTQHNYKIFDWNTLSLGYNFETEFIDGNSWDTSWFQNYDYGYSGNTIQNDVFINDLINIKDILFIRGGARLLSNSQYGTYVTPNASMALVLPTFKIKGAKTKFRGSFGQSVNTPTLYQRYGRMNSGWMVSVPNPDLQAEQMTGYDFGIEQSFFDEKLTFDAGYFSHNFKDYIAYTYDYDPVTWMSIGKYENVSKARIQGVEAGAKWKPNEKFQVNVNYTLADAIDQSTGKQLPGNARNRINGNIVWTPIDRLTLFAGVEAGSGRYYNSNDERTKGYVDVKLGGDVKIVQTENFDLHLQGTVYNLLNSKISFYKDYNGNNYYAPGINFMAGIFANYHLPEKI